MPLYLSYVAGTQHSLAALVSSVKILKQMSFVSDAQVYVRICLFLDMSVDSPVGKSVSATSFLVQQALLLIRVQGLSIRETSEFNIVKLIVERVSCYNLLNF